MPQPQPNDGETHDDWIERCMSNPTMKDEFDDNDQRLAVCQTIWDDSRSKELTVESGIAQIDEMQASLVRARHVLEAKAADKSANATTDILTAAAEIRDTIKPERLALANKMAEVRVAKRDDGDDAPHEIRGYAAVFYNGTPETEYQLWDDMVERIMPGAFDDVLAGKPDVRGLFNHDPDHVLGRTSAGTMSLSVDDKGLAYRITLGNTTVARDVAEHVQRGDIDGSSFAFRVQSERFRTEDGIDIREVEKVEPIYDVSPVTYPAYEGTTAGFRAIDDIAREVRAAVGKAGETESPPTKPPAPPTAPTSSKWRQGWRPRSSESKETRELREWAENLT